MRTAEARVAAAPVFARPDGDRWQELVRRLAAAGLLDEPAARALVDGGGG